MQKNRAKPLVQVLKMRLSQLMVHATEELTWLSYLGVGLDNPPVLFHDN